MTGVTTRHSEEPYAKSARTVLWEVLGVTRAPTRYMLGELTPYRCRDTLLIPNLDMRELKPRPTCSCLQGARCV